MQNCITQPGEYRTRNGSRVTVHAVSGNGTFSVKGSVWKMFRGKLRPRGYNIWKPTGQCMAVGVHDLDIVGEWVIDPLSIDCSRHSKTAS